MTTDPLMQSSEHSSLSTALVIRMGCVIVQPIFVFIIKLNIHLSCNAVLVVGLQPAVLHWLPAVSDIKQPVVDMLVVPACDELGQVDYIERPCSPHHHILQEPEV